MEPQIQYCRTREGVDIAYACEGAGLAFIVVPNLWGNIRFVYEINTGMLGMRSGKPGGRAVEGKVLGDGVMGVFTSAAQAIEGARRCVAASAEVDLPLHTGVHAGDVISEGENVYGGAVNIASRICGMSAAGEILVSDLVRGLARTSAGVTFEDRGIHALKGIEDAQRVFAVRAEGA